MTKKRFNNSKIEPVNTLISELLGSDRWVREGMTLGAIVNVWEDIVGEDQGRYLKPVELKNKKLLVQVPDSVWLNDVIFYKEKLIEKINEYMKSEVVEDIRFYIK